MTYRRQTVLTKSYTKFCNNGFKTFTSFQRKRRKKEEFLWLMKRKGDSEKKNMRKQKTINYLNKANCISFLGGIKACLYRC